MRLKRIIALFLMEFGILGLAIGFALNFFPELLPEALWTSFSANATLTAAMYFIDKRENHAKP